MRLRQSHAVNDGLVLSDAAVPAGLGIDVDVSARRVRSLHGAGAEARYRHFLGAAAAAAAAVDGSSPGEIPPGPAGAPAPAVPHEVALALAALSAWRAGTIEVRTDALRRLDAQMAVDSPPAEALAAALGLATGELLPFAALQRLSRFGWPAFAAGENTVAYLGGFAGLDGPWIAPPGAVAATEEPGVFHIVAGDERWRAESDIFGTTLSLLPADSEPPAVADSSRTMAVGDPGDPGGAPAVRLEVSEYNYIAALSVTAAAAGTA